jgi:nitric oxide reductase subunit C
MKQVILITILLSAAVYSAWVYTSGTSVPRINELSPQAAQGKLLWQHYNCTACHQIYGLGGYMGSDLTNEISIRGRDYTRAFLIAGTDKMPNFHLSQSEIDALLSYLQYTSRSGAYPVRTLNKLSYGGFSK